jgi:hypothetical protein
VLLTPALLLIVAVNAPEELASRAEVKAVQVVVDAPAGCADADRFFDGLRARTHLVRRATADEPTAPSLHVRLVRMRRHVSGEIRMVDERGEPLTRKVQGTSCDDVLQALTLTAAVALDPSVLIPAAESVSPRPVEGAQSEKAASNAAATVAQTATVTPSTEIQRGNDDQERRPGVTASAAPLSSPRKSTDIATRDEHRFSLGAAAASASLLSSGPSVGLALFGRSRGAAETAPAPWRGLTCGLAVLYLRNDLLLSPGAVEARWAGLVASLSAWGRHVGSLTIAPVGTVTAGLLSATGTRAVHTRAADVLWLGVGAAARVVIHLGSGFSLEVEGGVSVSLLRRDFYVTAPDHVVDSTSTVSPQVALGVAHGF